MDDTKSGTLNRCYMPSDFESNEQTCHDHEADFNSLSDERHHGNFTSLTDTNSDTKHNGDVSSTNRNKSHRSSCLNMWILLQMSLLACMEKYFEWFARIVAMNPWKVIIVTVGISCLLGLGLSAYTDEYRIEKLYVPTNTKSQMALREGAPYFINTFNSRQEEVIFLPKPGKYIFTNSCITYIATVIEQIVSIPNYRQLCKPKASFLKNYKQYNRNETCLVINPLELLRGSGKQVDVSASLEKAVNNKETLMSNGRPAGLNVEHMFSDFNKLSFENTSVHGIRMIFFMQQAERGAIYKEVMEWEQMFISKLKGLNKDVACVDISFAAERSMSDSVSEGIRSDLPFMLVVFAIMIFIACQIHGNKTNAIRGHNLLAIFGILSSALGVLAGFGLVIAFGVPFISIVGILPLLLISIGIDDVFIIIDEFDKMPNAMPASRKVSHTIAKVGATITMTTLTNIIVFGMGIFSNFPAIKYFCIFAAVTFSAEFLLRMTFFIALLSLDARRLKAGRRDCLPFCKGEDREKCWKWKEKFTPRKIMDKYGSLLLKWPSKLFVLLLTAGIFSAGIYGFQKLNTDFSRKLFARTGTYYRTYLNVVETKFSTEVEVGLMSTAPVNYASFLEQNKIISAPDLAFSSGFYIRRNISWMASFEMWANTNNIKINERNLSQNLNIFLNIPRYSFFNGDVIRDNNGKILASRIFVYTKGTVQSSFQKKAMLQLRKVLNEHEIPLTPMSNLFIYFEMYVVVTSEVMRNVLCAAGIVTFVAAFFCIHPSVTICVVEGLAILVVEIFGMMYFWNVSLHAISMLNLLMAVGFGVDYSAHFAHAFSVSNKGTVEDRILDALSSVGWSILRGGLCTCIGILTLAFFSSDIFQIFFRMLFCIIVFGIFNGLVLLPVLISLHGYFLRGLNSFWLPVWVAKKYKANDVIYKRHKSSLSTNSDHVKLISIVGISTRFPTAKNKDDFWELLLNGRRTLDEYPPNRAGRIRHFQRKYNPNRPMMKRMYVTKGSYLEDIEMFDHQFFGISSIEARTMDPQQRLILQNVFEAIDDAGLTLENLQTCRTGVYVGLMNWDYEGILRYNNTLVDASQFSGTGCDPSIAANRISFALNFTGPSLFVNTACSSSLSALSIAYDHLKSGRCDVAIVSAANIILDTFKHVAICQANMLATDGQSKSFDASADGYGRGEGIATVILKLNVIAEIDGDNIYCNILSCGINSDGRGAIPITAPSVEGQKTIFQEVLSSSGIRADDIHYVEAHGTGTIIGDRVETESIANIYSSTRTADNPLRIGSLKSNINHTESTSALAGLIKVCLMMKNKTFVPTVVEKLNPTLQIGESKMIVQRKLEDWIDDVTNPRTAAVNSFGYGGSNGHVIVQENVKKIDRKKDDPNSVDKPYVLVLSAHSVPALKETTRRFSNWLMEMNEDNRTALNVCFSLYQRRTHHDHRIAVGFDTIVEAADLLQRYSEDELAGNHLLRLTGGKLLPSPSKIGFVFGGQGSSRPGIIEDLRKNQFMDKYFRGIQSEISNCDPHLSIFNEETSNQNNIKESQALISLKIFAVEYVVAQFLIEKTSIYPLAVAGHSLGDISAACVSGYISLSDAVKMIIIRSNLQEECSAEGSMIAIGMSTEEAEELIDELSLNEKVVVAGKNDNNNVTLSGDSDAVAEVERYLKSERSDIFCRMLKVNKAFHSHHLDPLKDDFFYQVDKLKFGHSENKRPVCSSLYSTVKGERISYNAMSTDYFWENMRNPVLFNNAIQSMLVNGCRVLIEISPLPILSRYLTNIVRSTSPGTGEDPVEIIQSLPRVQESDIISHLYIQCIGRLYTIGYPVSWNQLFDYSKSSFIQYPLYSWQETKHWCFEVLSESDNATRLLGKVKKNTIASGILWVNAIDCFGFKFLSGHEVRNLGPIFPGAGYLEMAMEAIIGGPYLEPIIVEDLSFENILTLPTNTQRRVQTSMLLDESKTKGRLEVFHLGPKGNKIVLALAAVEKLNCNTPKERKSLKAYANRTLEASHVADSVPGALQDILNELPDCIEKDVFYEIANSYGFEYSGDFKLVDKVWRSSDKVLCRLKLTDSVIESLNNYVLHPAIIDVCFQSCIALLRTADEDSQDGAQIFPVGVRRVILVPPANEIRELYCVTSTISENNYEMKLITDSDEVLLVMEEFKTYRSTDGNRARQNTYPKVYRIGFDQYKDSGSAKLKEDVTFLFLTSKNATGLLEGFLHAVSDITTRSSKVVSVNHATKTNEILEEIRENIIVINKENPDHLVVVNLLPGVTREDKSEIDYLIQCQKETVIFCLEIIKLLSEMNIKKTTFGVVTTNSSICENDNIQNSNCPITATIIGLARTATLEQSSINILYADINLQLTQPEHSKILQFFLKVSNENEMIVRQNGYFYPKLERLQMTKDNKDEDHLQISATASLQFNHRSKYLSYSPSTQSFAVKVDPPLSPSSNQVQMKVSYISSFSSDLSPLLENIKMKNATSIPKFAIGNVEYAGETAMKVFPPGSQIMACIEGIMIQTSLIFTTDQVVLLPNTIAAHQVATLLPPLVNSYHILMKTAFNLPQRQSILVVFGSEGQGLSLSMILLASALNSNVHCAGSVPVEIVGELNVKRWSYQQIIKYIGHPNSVFNFIFCPTTVSDVITLAVSNMLKPEGRLVLLDCSNENNLISVPVPNTCSCVRLNVVEAPYLQPENIHAAWKECIDLLERSKLLSLVLALPSSIVTIANVDKYAEYSRFGFQTLELESVNRDINQGNISIERPALDVFGMKRNVCYLIIGGAGGFGLETLKWMIRRGAKFVIVCGRSTLTISTTEDFHELEQQNETKIIYVQADVSTQEGIDMLECSLHEYPPLAGVITSAVVYDDKLFTSIDEQSMLKVLRPKVIGTILLHRLIERLQIELDFFVLYSSIAAFGNIGQTSYSAANTFLDNYAAYMVHAVGKRCLSINWGALRIGEVKRNRKLIEHLENGGHGLLDPQEALDEMEEILVKAPSLHNVTIADIDWPKFLNIYLQLSTNRGNMFYQNLLKEFPEELNVQQSNSRSLTELIKGAENDEEKYEIVRSFVSSWLATWSGGIEVDVDLQMGLNQYGVDSTGAVGFQMQLQRLLGMPIEVVFLLQQDTNGFKLIQEILTFLAKDNDQSLIKEAQELLPEESDKTSDIRTSRSSLASSFTESSPSSTDISDEQDSRNTQQRLLVPIYTPKNSRNNFFCVHGTHRYYGHLSSIAAGFKYQELFGMYAFGFTNPTQVSDDWGSIKNLAMQYVTALQTIQPEGPYFLGGFSSGGLIALEMSSILMESHEQVGLLVMIDTYPWIPEARRNTRNCRTSILDDTESHKNLMINVYFMEDFLKRIAVTRLGMDINQYEEMLLSDDRQRVTDKLVMLSDEKGIEIPDIGNLYHSVSRNVDITAKAVREWHPAQKLFRGPTLYLAARDKIRSIASPGMLSNAEMWRACLGGRFYVLECPGDHYSMIKEPINAKNIGHSIAVAATSSLKKLRPFSVREQISFFKKSKLLLLKQHGLAVAVFNSKEGLTSTNAKKGKLSVNDDETALIFKEDQSKYSVQKGRCFQVKVKNIVTISRNMIPLDILVKSPLQTISSIYAVISMKTKHHNAEFVFFSRDDLVTFAQAMEALLQMSIPMV